jgi:hypothetical protein
MSGLQRVLKLYGSMIVEGDDGKKAVWVWDYKNNKARLKSEMTKEEILESDKAKYSKIKDSIDKKNDTDERKF